MKTSRTLRIATRKSPLALWQANTVKRLLEDLNQNVELNLIVTSGDKMQRGALAEVAIDDPSLPDHLKTGKGLFVKEVQEAIMSGEADLAVHSMKDLPVETTQGLRVAAVLPRARPNDTVIFSPALLTVINQAVKAPLQEKNAKSVLEFLNSIDWKIHAPIGTTSARRQSFLRGCLKSCGANITVLRGNVDTRLKRVAAGEFAFIMLARAGIDRLQLEDPTCMLTLPVSLSVPAPAQGVVAIECRESDTDLRRLLNQINHPKTALAAAVERAVLWYTGSGCQTALASHLDSDELNCWIATAAKTCSMRSKLSSEEMNMWQKSASSSDYSELFNELIRSESGRVLHSELIRHEFNELSEVRPFPSDME